jgi:hypothetical protein
LPCIPTGIVEAAQPVEQIVIDEHPALAWFCARYLAVLDLLHNCLRMHFQQFGGLFQVKRVHDDEVAGNNSEPYKLRVLQEKGIGNQHLTDKCLIK